MLLLLSPSSSVPQQIRNSVTCVLLISLIVVHLFLHLLVFSSLALLSVAVVNIHFLHIECFIQFPPLLKWKNTKMSFLYSIYKLIVVCSINPLYSLHLTSVSPHWCNNTTYTFIVVRKFPPLSHIRISAKIVTNLYIYIRHNQLIIV